MAALPSTTEPAVVAAARPRRFDAVTIGLHWATVALIVALFASAWSIGLATDGDQAAARLTFHRSLGAVMWAMAALRLGWRMNFAFLPSFPIGMPRVQQAAAMLSEYALYALLLIQPLTGLAQSLTRGRPFQLLVWTAPSVMARDKGLTRLFHAVHEAGAWLLLGLIAVHVCAALFHRFVLRDEVLQSMLPWKPRGRE